VSERRAAGFIPAVVDHDYRYGHRGGRKVIAATADATNAEWLLSTPAGGYVGSAAQEKEQAESGKDRDPAKVKEALGVK
jgi:hypothetical protein